MLKVSAEIIKVLPKSISKNITYLPPVTNRLLINKVDVQNNILHTLREASRVGEKAIYHYAFPVPFGPIPFEPFRILRFKKKGFGAKIRVN